MENKGTQKVSAIRHPPGEQGKAVQVSKEDRSSSAIRRPPGEQERTTQFSRENSFEGRQLKFQGKAVSREDNSSFKGKQFRRKTVQVSRKNGSRCKGKQCQVTREDGSSSALRRPLEKKGNSIQNAIQVNNKRSSRQECESAVQDDQQKLVTIQNKKKKKQKERQEVNPNAEVNERCELLKTWLRSQALHVPSWFEKLKKVETTPAANKHQDSDQGPHEEPTKTQDQASEDS